MKENLLILFIFGLLLTGMALERLEPTKQRVEMVDDKCPHNVIEPLKDSIGPIQIEINRTYSMNDRRKEFINKMRKR